MVLQASQSHERQQNKNVQQRPYTTEEHKPSHQGRVMTIPRKKEEMPSTMESTSSQEHKDHENQAQSTTTILNIDGEEFQKLQENDVRINSKAG